MIFSEKTIYATNIPDAWFQAVWNIIHYGRKYKIEHGSYIGEYRYELDYITFIIEHPYSEPWDTMLPEIPSNLGIPNPVEAGYIEQYMPYLMTAEIQEGEYYTYGNRIYNQIPYWINVLKKTPNTNQAVLQVAQPSDCLLTDPACLRHIDMRVRDNQLIFYPYFRSWDCWGGMPANLAGIAVLQKYMADEIGIEPGLICASSKGLHIYKYVKELAEKRIGYE